MVSFQEGYVIKFSLNNDISAFGSNARFLYQIYELEDFHAKKLQLAHIDSINLLLNEDEVYMYLTAVPESASEFFVFQLNITAGCKNLGQSGRNINCKSVIVSEFKKKGLMQSFFSLETPILQKINFGKYLFNDVMFLIADGNQVILFDMIKNKIIRRMELGVDCEDSLFTCDESFTFNAAGSINGHALLINAPKRGSKDGNVIFFRVEVDPRAINIKKGFGSPSPSVNYGDIMLDVNVKNIVYPKKIISELSILGSKAYVALANEKGKESQVLIYNIDNFDSPATFYTKDNETAAFIRHQRQHFLASPENFNYDQFLYAIFAPNLFSAEDLRTAFNNILAAFSNQVFADKIRALSQFENKNTLFNSYKYLFDCISNESAQYHVRICIKLLTALETSYERKKEIVAIFRPEQESDVFILKKNGSVSCLTTTDKVMHFAHSMSYQAYLRNDSLRSIGTSDKHNQVAILLSKLSKLQIRESHTIVSPFSIHSITNYLFENYMGRGSQSSIQGLIGAFVRSAVMNLNSNIEFTQFIAELIENRSLVNEVLSDLIDTINMQSLQFSANQLDVDLEHLSGRRIDLMAVQNIAGLFVTQLQSKVELVLVALELREVVRLGLSNVEYFDYHLNKELDDVAARLPLWLSLYHMMSAVIVQTDTNVLRRNQQNSVLLDRYGELYIVQDICALLSNHYIQQPACGSDEDVDTNNTLLRLAFIEGYLINGIEGRKHLYLSNAYKYLAEKVS